MNKHRTLVLAGAGATVAAAAATFGLRRPHRTEFGVLRTVEKVDIGRYAGRWFEIARYPTRYEARCVKNATAEYTQCGVGRLYVANFCTMENGQIDVVHGTATVTDSSSNAKLRLKYRRFMPAGDYWIIDLDEENYGWAVVGEPKREYLWILSRVPGFDGLTYGEICLRLVTQGYDPDKLVRSPQDGA
jgi:apolipoprotein D and lipocalin family protein